MVKRYEISGGPGEICMEEESWGGYVAYEDYTALLSEGERLQDFIASMLRRDTHDDSIKYHYQMYLSANDPLNKVWEDVTELRHSTVSEGLKICPQCSGYHIPDTGPDGCD